MPDWSNKKLKEIRDFIIKYVNALNAKNYQLICECFANNGILHRGMKNYVGRDEIIKWYKSQLDTGDVKFELKDASAGILPDSSAKCILWFEICARGYGREKKDIYVESIDLGKNNNFWQIERCFGIGYDPEYHKKYFKSATDEIK